MSGVLVQYIIYILCLSIQGDMTGDCVYATFCNMCSWCQMAREIKRRSLTLTIVNAQPATMVPSQPVMMAAHPGVIASQPMITSAVPHTIMAPRVM